jgi:hypothetical protein
MAVTDTTMISTAGRAAEPTVSNQIAGSQRDGNLNRRKVLKMTTASIATAAAVMPPLAVKALAGLPSSNPDAELLDLCRECEQLQAQLKAWFKEQEEASERYKPLEPPKPEALRVQSGDRDLDLPVPREWNPDLKENVRADWYTGSEVRKLESKPRTKRRLVKWVPWPEAQARADEIVAAFRSWQSECEAVRCSVGLDDTNAVPDAFSEKIKPLEERIIEMPAKTLEGFRAKARAVVSSYSTLEELEEEFTNMSVSHDIAWSLIRDLRQLPQEVAH